MKVLQPFLRSCLDLVFLPREDEQVVRNLTREDLAGLVVPELVGNGHPPVTALLPFRDGRVRALVHEAKYHGNQRAFELLAEVLAEYLLGFEHEEMFGKVILVPVPLSRARKRARGYNQAEEIALRAAHIAHIKMNPRTLVRTRDTPSQTNLTRNERKENMRAAFAAQGCPDPSCTYILFDDVVTTGATLESAAAALRAAGVLRVFPLALAH